MFRPHFLLQPRKPRRPRQYTHRKLRLENLEARQLMAVNIASTLTSRMSSFTASNVLSPTPYRPISEIVTADASSYTSLLRLATPDLQSKPGAPATLWLNFTGETISYSWAYFKDSAGTIPGNFKGYSAPVFDLDGDRKSFSDAEKQAITAIWKQVADDYSPFNINVSTVYPGPLANGKVLEAAIGGKYDAWFNFSTSGFSSIGGFTDSGSNIVLVFADSIAGWTLDGHGRTLDQNSAIATTISHESGHAFGLKHHRVFDSAGNVTDEYEPGTAVATAIMGDNLSPLRTTWDVGITDMTTETVDDFSFLVPEFENDLDVIGGSTNGFGWRSKPGNQSLAAAASMTYAGLTTSQVSGVISAYDQTDYYRFSTSGGPVTVRLDGPSEHSDLVGQFQLHSSNASFGTAFMPWTSSHARMDINLPAGTYYVKVQCEGGIGNLGMYTLTVDAPPRVLTSVDARVSVSGLFSGGSSQGGAVLGTETVARTIDAQPVAAVVQQTPTISPVQLATGARVTRGFGVAPVNQAQASNDAVDAVLSLAGSWRFAKMWDLLG